jgi:hypothetical protein
VHFSFRHSFKVADVQSKCHRIIPFVGVVDEVDNCQHIGKKKRTVMHTRQKIWEKKRKCKYKIKICQLMYVIPECVIAVSILMRNTAEYKKPISLVF